MSGYLPPYTVSDRMIELIAAIAEKVGRIDGRRELESRPHLRKNNRIRSVHSSLKIEANSLSLSETRDVINGRPVIGDQREIQEVKNAYKAYEKLKEIDPFSVEDLKAVHGIMTCGILEEAGRFRKGDEGVFSGDKCIFICPPFRMVSGLVDGLFSWLKSCRGKVHPLIAAAVFHYEFVFIHPFADGNGRMARLWHTAILYGWRKIFEFIPLESQIEKYQEAYYETIAKCNNNRNSDAFIELMLEMTDRLLDEIIAGTGTSEAETGKYVKRLLDIMEYGIPYTANEIMVKLGLKSKETLRKNYLKPAIEAGLIAMTLPEKPNSRNQSYVKL